MHSDPFYWYHTPTEISVLTLTLRTMDNIFWCWVYLTIYSYIRYSCALDARWKQVANIVISLTTCSWILHCIVHRRAVLPNSWLISQGFLYQRISYCSFYMPAPTSPPLPPAFQRRFPSIHTEQGFPLYGTTEYIITLLQQIVRCKNRVFSARTLTLDYACCRTSVSGRKYDTVSDYPAISL